MAVVSLVFAGISGDPYLEADGVNAWIVVFAAGLLALLIAFPFGYEIRLRESHPDRDKRWERTMVVWAGLAAIVLVVALVAGFDTTTLAGAAGLIAAIEAAMVVGTIVVWLLSGG